MGAPPGQPEAALPVNKGSAGAGNGQVTTPRKFRNRAAGCCGPSTPILIGAPRQHPRSPHGNARSEPGALRTLPSEAHRCRRTLPCRVPTPEASLGFWQPGPLASLPLVLGISAAVAGCLQRPPWYLSAQAGSGSSGYFCWACCAGDSSSHHQSLPLLTTKETCDRRAKTLSVSHPWPMWGGILLPGAHWEM